MASIHKDIPIDAHPDTVWDAVRDFGAVHQRLNPGFVTDCRLDGNTRIVTFHNGNVMPEEFVDCDDARRRLAYAIVGREGVKHYNGSVQVVGEGESLQPDHLDYRRATERHRALCLRADGSRRGGDAEALATAGYTLKCFESFRPCA